MFNMVAECAGKRNLKPGDLTKAMIAATARPTAARTIAGRLSGPDRFRTLHLQLSGRSISSFRNRTSRNSPRVVVAGWPAIPERRWFRWPRFCWPARRHRRPRV